MLRTQTLPGSLSVQFVSPHSLDLGDEVLTISLHLGGLLAPDSPELHSS